MGTNFSHGANFAMVGSTILRQNTTFFQTGYSPFSLDVQFHQFEQFKTRSLLAHTKGKAIFKDLLPPKKYFSQALYTFDIVQNDLTSGCVSNLTTEQVKETIPVILGKFTDVVKLLQLAVHEASHPHKALSSIRSPILSFLELHAALPPHAAAVAAAMTAPPWPCCLATPLIPGVILWIMRPPLSIPLVAPALVAFVTHLSPSP
ncbi:hypothetical protein ZIOFF_062831 [Zingiber officinale]|uniref:Uncharacterized protein n=1 Tax=Zingiber officinale TaxID=94328 RepID=A0A8J5KJL9_ZINOF|nr:hypothetical protein ZIOFF_062831 [Zingiber officinale]